MASRVGERQQTLGVVDCLSEGFGKINAMPWVLLFPIAIGLLLWRGAMLSAAPAVDRVVDAYFQLLPPDLLAATVDPGQVDQVRDLVNGLFRDLNLLSFLSLGTGIASRGAIPAVAAATMQPSVVLAPVGEPLVALALVIGLQLLGLLLGAVYLGLIAQRVRGECTSLGFLARRVWGYWLGVAGFLLVLCIGVLAASIPLALVLGLAVAFSAEAATGLLFAFAMGWQVVFIWVTVFMFFVVDAAVVGELGPLRAAKSSFRVVGTGFWRAAGFILLYLFITYGILALWGQLGNEPWATIIALLGNAYIMSGLAAGSMVYYRSRASALAVEVARPKLDAENLPK